MNITKKLKYVLKWWILTTTATEPSTGTYITLLLGIDIETYIIIAYITRENYGQCFETIEHVRYAKNHSKIFKSWFQTEVQ